MNYHRGKKRHIVVPDKIVAVAQLKTPETPDIGLFEYVLAGGIKILLTGGLFNTIRFLGMLDEAGSICHNLPGRVWYLNSLAVSKSCQGQGLGSRIIADCIIPYIQERDGGLLTLITNTEKNRFFIRRMALKNFMKCFFAGMAKSLVIGATE